jgi:phosphoglycerate dehydrogenase-like enzyme
LLTFDESPLQRAMEGVSDYRIIVASTREQAFDAIADAEVACVDSFDVELLKRGENLKWIQAYLGGVDRMMFPEIVESPVTLTCVKECFAAPGAEHAMATILAVSYRLDYYLRSQARRTFTWSKPAGLAGLTLGIIGFGNIGQALALRARPFGLRVLACARRPRANPSPADELVTPDELPRLLMESDFVVLAVPSTNGTKQLLAASQLAQMKSTAWLIDISGRDAIIDQSAIVNALRERRIGGADLQFKLPPPKDSELWELDNLIMSQFSANSEQETLDAINFVVDNMRRYKAGQTLHGLVDKTAGY